VIRRGWDWIGLTSSSPGLVAGLVEAPGLSVALTLNKGDFVRAGRRGITYLAYRKALQEAVQAQLTAWGEARDREDSARRRAARPLEKDLEAVLRDLADEFPALAAWSSSPAARSGCPEARFLRFGWREVTAGPRRSWPSGRPRDTATEGEGEREGADEPHRDERA
jgi:hypothetical protein